jgi:hypothetical protein
LRVDARTSSPVQIYEIRGHVCLPDHDVRTNFDFGFEGRACPNVAIGDGDVDPSAAFPNGVADGRLDNVRVSTGAARWVNELGFPGSIRCDASHPCDLVVRVEITDGTVFVTVPLCGTRPCTASSSGSHGLAGVRWPWVLTIVAVLVGLWIAGTRRHRAQAGVS